MTRIDDERVIGWSFVGCPVYLPVTLQQRVTPSMWSESTWRRAEAWMKQLERGIVEHRAPHDANAREAAE